MCGIVGYIGDEQAAPILIKGLEKLKYRGYDSAGVCTNDGEKFIVEKEKGKIEVLQKSTDDGKKIAGTVGIGHTRWATHGEPSKINAHPHLSSSGRFAVVHNGIIENYMELKQELLEKGLEFRSSTDTEVIAQLLEYHYNGDLLDTVIKIMPLMKGSYALGIMYKEKSDEIIAVRKGSPLIIGIGENENYLASDVPAILDKTRNIYRLDNEEIAVIKRDSIVIYDTDKNVVEKAVETITWSTDAAEKDGYEHFMLKEIMEQPKAIHNTIAERIKDGRVVLDEIHLTPEQIRDFNKINIVACGSAYHVGVVAKYIFEKVLRKPVEVDVASEFKYRDPIIDEKTLTIVISQSGETADTKEAMYEAQRKGSYAIAIVNVIGSAIASDADDVIYTLAGPEIAVATTKAYSAQLAVIYMMAIYFGDILGKISEKDYKNYVSELLALPEKIQLILDNTENIKNIASKLFARKDVFFIGRNIDYALSLEGSLKLKEISYIHSEAYAAGELKHGTISLIENGTLVIALATYEDLHEKICSNIKEVQSRGAYVLGIGCENRQHLSHSANSTLFIPKICDMMLPSLAVVPMQILAYYMARFKGCEIDTPRNLAKSVTVE